MASTETSTRKIVVADLLCFPFHECFPVATFHSIYPILRGNGRDHCERTIYVFSSDETRMQPQAVSLMTPKDIFLQFMVCDLSFSHPVSYSMPRNLDAWKDAIGSR